MKKKNQINILARGSKEVAKQAEDDLLVDDPKTEKAMGIIDKSMKGHDVEPRQSNKDSLSNNSEDSKAK